jgi:Ca2+/Na+ antiporter
MNLRRDTIIYLLAMHYAEDGGFMLALTANMHIAAAIVAVVVVVVALVVVVVVVVVVYHNIHHQQRNSLLLSSQHHYYHHHHHQDDDESQLASPCVCFVPFILLLRSTCVFVYSCILVSVQ